MPLQHGAQTANWRLMYASLALETKGIVSKCHICPFVLSLTLPRASFDRLFVTYEGQRSGRET